MDPRLKESKKWTRFPSEFEKEIHKILNKAFPLQSQKGCFIVEGRIYKSEICVRLGFLEKNNLAPTLSESSVEYDSSKENVKKIIDLAIDAGASLLENYFSDPKGDYPYEWMKFDMEKKEVFLKISKVHPELEAQADALLNIDSQGLTKGEDYDEEALAMKKIFEGED